jgi:hypothetical protein
MTLRIKGPVSLRIRSTKYSKSEKMYRDLHFLMWDEVRVGWERIGGAEGLETCLCSGNSGCGAEDGDKDCDDCDDWREVIVHNGFGNEMVRI